jgi:hypothetical protein
MSSVKYQGEQGFIRQTGGGVSYDDRGLATQTIIWRGPVHKVTTFRRSISGTSPDYPGLKLRSLPNESFEGAYVRVTAIYGGISSEVDNSFPTDIDANDPLAPTISETANFQTNSTVVRVIVASVGAAEYNVYYRHPVNSISYTRSTKPSNVQGRSRSGIGGESDPVIIDVSLLSGIDLAAAYSLDPTAATGVKLMNTTWAEFWKVETVALDFLRSNTGQTWNISETWAKLIVQADNDGNLD